MVGSVGGGGGQQAGLRGTLGRGEGARGGGGDGEDEMCYGIGREVR